MSIVGYPWWTFFWLMLKRWVFHESILLKNIFVLYWVCAHMYKNLSLNGFLNKWKNIAQNLWNVSILLLNLYRIVESVCNQPQIIYKGKITRQRGFWYFVNLWTTMNNFLYLKMYLCLCKLCPILALKIVEHRWGVKNVLKTKMWLWE
jgi:hypothetical protein